MKLLVVICIGIGISYMKAEKMINHETKKAHITFDQKREPSLQKSDPYFPVQKKDEQMSRFIKDIRLKKKKIIVTLGIRY